MEAKDLIERAAYRMGSQAAVARAMGVLPLRVTQWKNGARPCPVERIDELAELAGLSHAEQVRAVWEAVRRSMGKAVAALALTVAAMLGGFGANDVAQLVLSGSESLAVGAAVAAALLLRYRETALMYIRVFLMSGRRCDRA